MAPTDERSTLSTPRWLVIAAAVLLCARLVELGLELRRPQKEAAQAVEWSELAPATAMQALAASPPVRSPVLPELSPETEREMSRLAELSREAGKPVIYEFYADWSDPCKAMESVSLANHQVREVIHDKFIAVRVSDRLKEAGSNPPIVTDLQKKYRIFAFPTLVAVDERGETIGLLVGNCSSLTVYRFLSRALHSFRTASPQQPATADRWQGDRVSDHLQNTFHRLPVSAGRCEQKVDARDDTFRG